MMLKMLIALAFLAGLYTLLYDHHYMLRWSEFVLLGLALEFATNVLANGRFAWRSGASAMTAALLVMSVPTTVPFLPMFFALVVAVVIIRMGSSSEGINLNPMLVGRLFLMLAYGESVVNWTLPGIDPDTVTTATPLELFHQEDAIYEVKRLLACRLCGSWEDMYQIVPGSPGEMFGILLILFGLYLIFTKTPGWRTGLSFVLAFLATCAVLRQPLVFNLFSGAVLFAAVFIATDPKSTPTSSGAQWMAGILAGVTNALIRTYTFYSEGIVFSFLLVNLLAPTLDRLTFTLRGMILRRRRKRFAPA